MACSFLRSSGWLVYEKPLLERCGTNLNSPSFTRDITIHCSCAERYMSPVSGLYAIGCQVCAASSVGVIRNSFSVRYESGLTFGRPVFRSMDEAHRFGTYDFAEMTLPVLRSST